MSENNFGAFTGEICAGMLKEFSVRYVILGHSERRQYQKESDALISKKAAAVHGASLKPIVCVGETLAEREAGQMEKVLESRCAAALPADEGADGRNYVAYEPVWAIGTGKTATTQQAQDTHAFIRGVLANMFDDATAKKVRIQYGGSVKAGQCQGTDGPAGRGRRAGRRRGARGGSFADIIKNSI